MKKLTKLNIESSLLMFAFLFLGILYGRDGFNFLNVGAGLMIVFERIVRVFVKEE